MVKTHHGKGTCPRLVHCTSVLLLQGPTVLALNPRRTTHVMSLVCFVRHHSTWAAAIFGQLLEGVHHVDHA